MIIHVGAREHVNDDGGGHDISIKKTNINYIFLILMGSDIDVFGI